MSFVKLGEWRDLSWLPASGPGAFLSGWHPLSWCLQAASPLRGCRHHREMASFQSFHAFFFSFFDATKTAISWLRLPSLVSRHQGSAVHLHHATRPKKLQQLSQERGLRLSKAHGMALRRSHSSCRLEATNCCNVKISSRPP